MLRLGASQCAGRSDVHGVAGRAGGPNGCRFPTTVSDAVCLSYLLRYVEEPASVVTEMVRGLRPGGQLASLEFFVPPASGWRAAWRLYVTAVFARCRLVDRMKGVVAGGPIPRHQHPGALSALPAGMA